MDFVNGTGRIGVDQLPQRSRALGEGCGGVAIDFPGNSCDGRSIYFGGGGETGVEYDGSERRLGGVECGEGGWAADPTKGPRAIGGDSRVRIIEAGGKLRHSGGQAAGGG
jgi:hypothetical protein